MANTPPAPIKPSFQRLAHWTNDPAPKPDPIDTKPNSDEKLSPTRYGDWEHKGIAVDF